MCENNVGDELVKLKGYRTIEYICDSCKVGEMKPTGIMLTCEPPLYQHKCTNCGEINSFRNNYPRTVLIIE